MEKEEDVLSGLTGEYVISLRMRDAVFLSQYIELYTFSSSSVLFCSEPVICFYITRCELLIIPTYQIHTELKIYVREWCAVRVLHLDFIFIVRK